MHWDRIEDVLVPDVDDDISRYRQVGIKPIEYIDRLWPVDCRRYLIVKQKYHQDCVHINGLCSRVELVVETMARSTSLELLAKSTRFCWRSKSGRDRGYENALETTTRNAVCMRFFRLEGLFSAHSWTMLWLQHVSVWRRQARHAP